MAGKKSVFVCINKRGGKACIGPGSREVFRALRKRARERAKESGCEITVERTGCMGYCSNGPNVKIYGGGFFHETTLEDVDDILDAVK